MSKVVFVVDSDIHFKHEIKNYKADHVQKITDLADKEKVDALICVGDLTENGWDGKKSLCWKYGGDYDQLTPLKEQYVKLISKKMPVFLCAGNHDYYVPWPYIHHGVLEYIKDKHGAQRYSFDLGKLHFICLDRFPDDESVSFLKKDIVKHKDQDMVIFFHYNPTGPWSDWWSDKDKERFYEIIKDYKIKALLVGHWHISQTTEWKGLKVIMAGGRQLAKCTYDGEINVEFF